jgi:hypothetical protein
MSAYQCNACTNVIPAVVTHLVTEHPALLCVRCAEDTRNHAVLHPDCAVDGHSALDHPLVVGTALSAHRALLRIWHAQKLTG